MKTLQAKELVYESGRPTRKYYLTDEGWEVARRLRAANDSRDPVSAPTQHLDLQDLQSGVEETDGRINQRRTTNKRQDRPPQKQSNDKPQIGLGLGSPSATPQSRRLGRTDREPDFFEILSSPPPGPAADVRRHWEKFGTSNGRTSSNVVTSTATKESNSLSGTSSGRTSSNVVTSMVTKESNSLPGFDPIYIVPGTFTVELIIDNREVRAKQDRDYIQNGLISRGVKVTTRALEVGDAIWVARLHDPTVLTKAGEEGDEIVLDWIVERKRLDDLIGSIKDGRFTEQKFRLRKSGARNVVYLIEDIGLAAESEQGFHEHIQSAIASTQVVNGFFVKRTPKVDDTIAYLARMTKMLKQQYEGEMLSVIPSTQLSSETYLPLLATLDSPHYITYNSFAAMASKTDSLTLRDIFLKMLMCTRGITGEKAIEIQKHWSTPCEFIEAMAQFERSADKATASNQRKDMVFNAAGNLVGRRKIGKAFSAKLGETWGEY